MTRKDYKAIAKIIHDLTENNEESFTPNNLINRLSDLFYTDNNRFQFGTFINACGYDYENGKLKKL